MTGVRSARTGRVRRTCLALVLALLSAASAGAQGPPPADATAEVPRRRTPGLRRVEVSVLGGVITGADLGVGRAQLIGNQAPTGRPTALFTTSARITGAPLVEGRVGVRVTRHWSVEGAVSAARPDFEVRIAGDVEGMADVTATSPLTQVSGEGAVMYRWQGRRVSPFLLAGAGWVRQLDQPRTTVETGQVYAGGGGAVVALAPQSRGFASRLHLRGDVRLAVLRGGITLEDDRPASVVALVGLLLAW